MSSRMNRTIRVSLLASAGAFALALALAPMSLDFETLSLKAKTAFAKDGGGGGGGGGGGNGGGHGGGDGGHGAGLGAGDSAGHSPGNNVGKAEGQEASDPGHQGKSSNMGSLNASHASPEALAHASPSSRVGQLEAYANAVQQGNLALAAQALAKASNKAVTANMVSAVNTNMGLTSAFDSAMAKSNATMDSFVGNVNADRSSK